MIVLPQSNKYMNYFFKFTLKEDVSNFSHVAQMKESSHTCAFDVCITAAT